MVCRREGPGATDMMGDRGEAGGGRLKAFPVGDGIDTDGELLGDLNHGPAVRHSSHHSLTEVHRIGSGHALTIAYLVSIRQPYRIRL
jgi:hypothetical protein